MPMTSVGSSSTSWPRRAGRITSTSTGYRSAWWSAARSTTWRPTSSAPRARSPIRATACAGSGTELTSQLFTDWCKEQDIELRFIQPGKPDQNAYIERFNRTYREEVLSAYLFDALDEVREITAEWIERYNEIRPHDALGSLPPALYRERLLQAETPA